MRIVPLWYKIGQGNYWACARTETTDWARQDKKKKKETCFSAKFTHQGNKCKWIIERGKNCSCHSSTLLVCNSHHHLSELAAGNIDINALNDDKYFPVKLSLSLFTLLLN